MKRLLSLKRTAAVVAVAAVAVVSAVTVALADNVLNDVVAGGSDTFTAGGSTTINYRIQQTGQGNDGQPGCNAADGSPATVTINAPANVTATPGSLTFTACGNGTDQPVQFSSNVPGDYPITVSVNDGGVGTYSTNQASFTLHVNAPPDSTAPIIQPTVTGTLGDNGWYTSDVKLTWSVTDPESAISSQTGCGETNVTSDQLSVDYTCSATSAGGTSSKTVSIKRDAQAPTVLCGSADDQWHNSDVTIACTANDGGGSGLANPLNDASFSLLTNVPTNTETSNASTGSRLVSDLAGNTATAGPVSGNKVDKKAPSAPCDSADGQWHPTDVSIACTASDGGSGLHATSPASFNLVTNVPANTETADASTDSRVIKDAVGNEVTAGPVSGNQVDKKAPGISCDTPAPTFTVNQSPANVTGTATDGGSGPASQSVSKAATTSSAGSKTVSLTATDAVGNSGSQNCSYSVLYGFDGLFAPIDRPNVINLSKAGQAIPLKWRLVDANGAPITTLTSVTVQVASIPCSFSTTEDLLEEYAASSSGLQNLGNGYYQFNWKTPTSYANSCKNLKLDLGEGSARLVAFISFKK